MGRQSIGGVNNSIVEQRPPSTGMYCVIVNDDCETPPSEACMFVTIESPIDVEFRCRHDESLWEWSFCFYEFD